MTNQTEDPQFSELYKMIRHKHHTEYTPTPWRVTHANGELIVGPNGEPLARMLGDSLVDVDADFIVRGVNSHADLVAALEDVESKLRALWQEQTHTWTRIADILDVLDAARQRARGEE